MNIKGGRNRSRKGNNSISEPEEMSFSGQVTQIG